MKIQLTELGDEKEEHEDGGEDGDYAAGERSAVEILVDLGIDIEVPQLPEEPLHLIDPRKQNKIKNSDSRRATNWKIGEEGRKQRSDL